MLASLTDGITLSGNKMLVSANAENMIKQSFSTNQNIKPSDTIPSATIAPDSPDIPSQPGNSIAKKDPSQEYLFDYIRELKSYIDFLTTQINVKDKQIEGLQENVKDVTGFIKQAQISVKEKPHALPEHNHTPLKPVAVNNYEDNFEIPPKRKPKKKKRWFWF